MIDRHHKLSIARQAKAMGVEAIYRRQNISKPSSGHKIYSAAVAKRFTQRVLSWRLTITLEVDFCIEAILEAMVRHGKPEIFNTDQGSQFTSLAFTQILKEAGISTSLDGKGAWRDNVFVERLWKAIKCEEVYLHTNDTVSDARDGIGKYMSFYNSKRSHSSVDQKTPDQVTSIYDNQHQLPHNRGLKSTNKNSQNCSNQPIHFSSLC